MTKGSPAGACAGSNYPFLTLKERDNETGLDYFLARYYSSTQGRFTSPDEFTGGPDELYYFADDASANPTFYADLRKPQSLNKYQYSYNNPLRYVDPDGHDPEEPEPQDPKPVVVTPLPGRLPPVVVPNTTTTKGPTDQEIIEGAKSVLDTVTYYTGIDALADWLRPKIMPTPAPPPTTTPPTTAQPTTGTPPQQQVQPQTAPAPAQMSPRPIDKPRDKGHRKGKRGHDKHTRKTPGESRPPGFKPRTPPRPQDMPPKPPKPPKGKLKEWEP